MQTPRTQAVRVGIHNHLHFAAVDPDFFAPAIMVTQAGEKPSAGGTALDGTFLFCHLL